MRRLSIDEVRQFVENAGYKMISKDYQNNNFQHIVVQCPHGHPPYPVLFSNFYKGSRCPECANESRSYKRNKWTREKITRLVEGAGYKLNNITIDDEHHKFLNVTCPNNHTYTVYLNHFLSGSRCGKCRGAGVRKYDYRSIAEFYLNNSRKDTAEKFNVLPDVVSHIFSSVYRCSKREYISRKVK